MMNIFDAWALFGRNIMNRVTEMEPNVYKKGSKIDSANEDANELRFRIKIIYFIFFV